MNKGILYILLSGICFLVVNFFVKILGAGPNQDVIAGIQHFPGHELVLARSIVSFAISFAVIRRSELPTWGNNKKWLLIRGISGTVALTIFFYTVHYLPLAIASIVQNLAPIFTVILAMIFLKERVRILQWVFVGISFTGVFLIGLDQLISKDVEAEEISFFWLGMGMISAAFSGIAYMAIMKMRNTDAPITIVMYFPLVAIPLMTILCFWEFTMPRGIEWIILLIVGVFTQFAQILLTKALHEGSAATITPFQYLGAIYAFLVGYFLFDETFTWIVNIGISLAIIGVLMNAFLRQRT